jgi:hypothetical protein
MLEMSSAYDLIRSKLARAAALGRSEAAPSGNLLIRSLLDYHVVSSLATSEVFAGSERVQIIDDKVDNLRTLALENGIPSMDYQGGSSEAAPDDEFILAVGDTEVTTSADLTARNAKRLSVDTIEGSIYTHVMFSPGNLFTLTIQYLSIDDGNVDLEYIVNNKAMHDMTDEEAEVIETVLEETREGLGII